MKNNCSFEFKRRQNKIQTFFESNKDLRELSIVNLNNFLRSLNILTEVDKFFKRRLNYCSLYSVKDCIN